VALQLKRGALMYLVTSVGVNSSYGRIMSALATEVEDTPLQRKLEGLAEFIRSVSDVWSHELSVQVS